MIRTATNAKIIRFDDKLMIRYTIRKAPNTVANNTRKSVQNHFCLRGQVNSDI